MPTDLPPLPAPGTDWHAWIRWGISVAIAAVLTYLGSVKLDAVKQDIKQEIKALGVAK